LVHRNETILVLIVGMTLLLGTASYFYFSRASGEITSTSSGAGSPSGLNLTLSLNASSIRAGHYMGFTYTLFNTWSRQNNVSSANDWAVPNLVNGPCGPTNSPIAVAVVAGNYALSNISEAPKIEYGMMCTTVTGGNAYYDFQPLSDEISIGKCQTIPPHPCGMLMASTGTIIGYWSGGQILSFTSGAYTVVVADEWGQVAVSSFTVEV
jgi:hypothetical protein